MSLARTLQTACRLTVAERRAALAAFAGLALVRTALAEGGLAVAERRLARVPRLLPRRCAVSVGRLAILVGAVARRLPRAECLAQSLVLARLVAETGAPGVMVRIGVRPGENELAAHAWVEVGGAVVNDSDDVATRFPVIEARAPALPA